MQALFISHSGVSPIVASQGIPHMQALSQQGVNFTFLSFKKRVEPRSDWFNQELKKYNIDWRTLNYWPWPFFPASLLDIIKGFFYISWLAKKKNIKIIQARSYIPAIMVWLTKKFSKVKFIFDMRGLVPDEQVYCGAWPQKSFKYKAAKYLEKKLLCNADAIIVVSPSFKSYVQNHLLGNIKKKIIIIPNCVDNQKFYLQDKNKQLIKKLNLENKYILVYSGSAVRWHLVDQMINFFKVLKKNIPQAHFLILTYERNIVKEIIRQKNLPESDYSLISVQPPEIPQYLALADLAISFIEPTFTKRIACFPLKFAEYLAIGLPVIINSKISGTDIMVKKNKLGIVIDKLNQTNYQKAAEKIKIILKDPSIRQRCFQFAKHNLSLEQAVQKYARIYQSLAN